MGTERLPAETKHRPPARTAALAAIPLVLVAASLWGLLIAFGAFALDNGSPLDRWDDRIERRLAAHRTSTWNTITHYVTWGSETITIIILTAISVVVLRLVLHRWREGWLLVLATTGQALIFLCTQLVIGRQRPPVPQLDHGIPTSSYPSGHTAAAVAFYGGLAVIAWWTSSPRPLRVVLTLLGVLAPVSIALARMYRGMHHPTDVLASAVYSSCWLVVVTVVVMRVNRITERSTADDRVPVAA